MSRGSGRCRQEISLNDSFDHHGDTTGGALKSSSPQQEWEQDSTDNGICLIAFAKKWDQAQFRPKVEISIHLFEISNFKKPAGDTHSYSCSYLQSPHHNKHWNQKLPGHRTLSTVLLKESAQYKQSYSTIKQGTVDCKHTFSMQNSCQVSATTPPVASLSMVESWMMEYPILQSARQGESVSATICDESPWKGKRGRWQACSSVSDEWTFSIRWLLSLRRERERERERDREKERERDREREILYHQGALGGNDAMPGAVMSLVYHVLLHAAVSYWSAWHGMAWRGVSPPPHSLPSELSTTALLLSCHRYTVHRWPSVFIRALLHRSH